MLHPDLHTIDYHHTRYDPAAFEKNNPLHSDTTDDDSSESSDDGSSDDEDSSEDNCYLQLQYPKEDSGDEINESLFNGWPKV